MYTVLYSANNRIESYAMQHIGGQYILQVILEGLQHDYLYIITV